MKWKWPELARKWKEALGKYQFVLLVLAVGVFLLLLPTGGGQGEGAGPAEEAAGAETFDLEAFEEKLARALSQIEGAGETRVVLTLDSGSRQVLARDQEEGGDGGMSSTVVTIGQGSGSQQVVPLQTVAPRFRGALVVCPGGDDPEVQLQLIRAVSGLTGLGSDRITICQGNL